MRDLASEKLSLKALALALGMTVGLGAQAGTWTKLRDLAPGNVQLMLLMTDGTVMAADSGQGTNNGRQWYKLTPDSSGSYVNGKWTTLASMANTRLYYSSVVLPDGRVFVAGGEYSNDGGGATAEIYSPQLDQWTTISVPTNVIDPSVVSPVLSSGNQAFLDCGSMLLPDGRVLLAPVGAKNGWDTPIYDPVNNTWSMGVRAAQNQNESSWVRLPDGSILTVDSGAQTTERYLPSGYLAGHVPPIAGNRWIADQSSPVSLFGNPGTEIGPAMLLPDGTALFVGGNGNSAIYTPSGDDSLGSWAPGPVLPNVIQYPLDANGVEIQSAPTTVPGAPPDAAAASLVNGRVLYAFSGKLYNDPRAGTTPAGATNTFWQKLKNPVYPAPTSFFIYDPLAETFAPIVGPTGTNDDIPAFKTGMLPLPDGSVLYAHQGRDVYTYSLDPVHNADERIDPSSRPVIAALQRNPDGTWHLTGTQLNGLSQGATYGDDLQMDSNYPLVQLRAESGEVTYARTYNWSSTGVQTGTNVVSTEFAVPPVIAGTGAVSVVVVANGIPSDPVPLPVVGAEQVVTFSGNQSMGGSTYEILGGYTKFVDDGTASGYLLRADGGRIRLLDSASGGTARISVGGGMGNGGLPGHLQFFNNSTAAGAQIANHAGERGPNFKNASPNPMDGWAGETRFFDNAKAGTAYITHDGESHDRQSNGSSGGYTAFAGNASGDHATFVTRGATIGNGRGGRVDFVETSTADHGVFTNLNSNNGSSYSQGRTVFFDRATAGQGLFVNVGAMGDFLGTGGTTEFRMNSTAGNGTFINLGPTGGSFPQPGKTQFFDTASAGNGVFTNRPGAGSGGGVEFWGHSTAGLGQFVNDGASGAPLNGGSVIFKEDSSAGQASFHTLGAYGGYVVFYDRTSADHANFLLDPQNNNNRVQFFGSSTASNATFEIGASTYLQFFESSSAGNATIWLRANGGGGALGSFGGTAGNATITVMGAEVPGAVGADLDFASPGRAENATVVVNGASVTTFGARGGIVSFDYGSSAGRAHFTVNGGSNGGAGGRLGFGRGGTGDGATVVVNPGGTVDVAGNAYYGGTRLGSLAGGGSVYLGFAELSVGGLNTDTEISGVISDYAVPGYYGALTKIGTGTLTLSGTNTYKGLTTVVAGTLAVNGVVPGPVQVNTGGTLKGSANVGGSLTVAPGGVVAPGNSPGTLTVGGDFVHRGLLEMEVAGPNAADRDLLVVHGDVSLGGTLVVVFSGYAPSANETFTLLQAGGSFSETNLNVVVLGLKPGFQMTRRFAGGQLLLTASTSGQPASPGDPIQALGPWFSQASGFVYSVYGVAGLKYDFETSTDLSHWTRLSETAGANAMIELRHLPSPADASRFYRVIQTSAAP